MCKYNWLPQFSAELIINGVHAEHTSKASTVIGAKTHAKKQL